MAKTENWQKKDDVFKAYERAIKELGDVARRVPKNTIIEKAMSYPAPRYYITLEVAIRNISLMYRGIQPDMYNPMKIDMYDSIFRKFVAKGLKYPGYSYLETIINNEAPSFYIEKRQFVRIINDKLFPITVLRSKRLRTVLRIPILATDCIQFHTSDLYAHVLQFNRIPDI